MNTPKVDAPPNPTHVEKVVMGEDDDSISTLGGRTMATSVFIPQLIGASSSKSPSSAISSDQSFALMGSRVTQLEDQLNSMEVSIKSSLDTSMEKMFQKYLTPTKRVAKATKKKAL